MAISTQEIPIQVLMEHMEYNNQPIRQMV